MKKLPFILLLFLASCASLTPKQREIASNVEAFALSTALNVGLAYATGGGMTPALVKNSIDGAAQVVRSIIGTPAATNPQAIADALALGSNSKVVDTQIVPPVAAKASEAIKAGADPKTVLEAVASGLNQAAAELNSVHATPTPAPKTKTSDCCTAKAICCGDRPKPQMGFCCVYSAQ